jgi:hypothetical protein
MKITELQKKDVQKDFTAVWNFCKRFYNPETSPVYAHNVAYNARELSKELSPLGIGLLNAVLEDISERGEKNG